MVAISLQRAVITGFVAPAVIGLAMSSPRAAGRQPGDIGRIERGTQVPVRTTENIEERSLEDRVFAGEVADDVTDASGRVAIPRGSPVELVVRDTGNGDLALDLESVVVNGQRYAVRTSTERVDAAPRSEDSHRTATYVGGGALLGTIIGAVAGGGKGAIIGAGVGALAGGSVGLYLDKQRKELEAVAETKKTENGTLVTKLNGDILFTSGSAVLKPEAVDQLQKVGDIIAKYSDDRVRIEGHTDSTGGKAKNEELSQHRADAVKAILVSRGVKETQITALGLGEDHPVADNKTADGRAKNRRVELHIDVPNPTPAA